MYGSMASSLAIDSSDLDLAVVGLEFNGNRDMQIREMRKLLEDLRLIMKHTLFSSEFIDKA